MLEFFETKCDTLFRRTFALTEDGVQIGGGSLNLVENTIEIRDFYLDESKNAYEDLLAASLLNAACNTQVHLVRVKNAPCWSRFGLKTDGQTLVGEICAVVFDSVCRQTHGESEDGSCK